MDIFYPFVQNQAKGDELRYSLRSIEQHAKFDYRIVLVGDKPDWCTGITHIQTPPPPPHYIGAPTTHDAVSKLITFLKTPGTDCMFLRTYDDIYFLQDCDEIEICKYYTQGDWSKQPDRVLNTWGRQLRTTLNTLRDAGYSQHNTETHLPEVFVRRLMLEVIEKFNPLENRLLTSTLYANYIGVKLHPVTSGVRACFYDHGHKDSFYGNSVDEIRLICAHHKFLNHDDPGYSRHMIQFLKERFPNKSRFEND